MRWLALGLGSAAALCALARAAAQRRRASAAAEAKTRLTGTWRCVGERDGVLFLSRAQDGARAAYDWRRAGGKGALRPVTDAARCRWRIEYDGWVHDMRCPCFSV
jgi:hypothetical protein